MRKRLIIILLTVAALTGQAQIKIPWGEAYFSAEELPIAAVWLPAPPDTLSPQGN
ncbi:MAG: hypothetical protein IJ888_04820 [Prevotella sp.]|nr:hypothetical protein [Prevotella sp.]